MTIVINVNTKCRYAERHFAKCRYAECCYDDLSSCVVLLNIVMCRYFECQYAENHYAECR
jgi:hypothetical protein